MVGWGQQQGRTHRTQAPVRNWGCTHLGARHLAASCQQQASHQGHLVVLQQKYAQPVGQRDLGAGVAQCRAHGWGGGGHRRGAGLDGYEGKRAAHAPHTCVYDGRRSSGMGGKLVGSGSGALAVAGADSTAATSAWAVHAAWAPMPPGASLSQVSPPAPMAGCVCANSTDDIAAAAACLAMRSEVPRSARVLPAPLQAAAAVLLIRWRTRRCRCRDRHVMVGRPGAAAPAISADRAISLPPSLLEVVAVLARAGPAGRWQA